MTSKPHFWIGFLFLAVLSGCYPKGPEYASDLDLVYTNYSTAFQFASKKTFSLPDSVIKVTGDLFNDPDGDNKPQFLSQTYSKPILDQITKNMTSYGWTKVDKNASPDVILLVSSMTTTTIYYYYDWSYWDWWYPGWYPSWGWYYPGYFYPPYVTGYSSGSVFIQMVDHSTAIPQDGGNIPVEWNCILNGLTSGSTSEVIGRIQTNLDKAFVQSPYLKH